MTDYTLDLIAKAFSMWFKGKPADIHVLRHFFECTLVPSTDRDIFVLTNKQSQESVYLTVRYRTVSLDLNGKTVRSIHNLTGSIVVW